MKISVHGRIIFVERVNDKWVTFYQTIEGKRHRAANLIIPAEFNEDEVVTWIADLFHESATEQNPRVEILE
jgi:hypothetical protein